MPFLTLSVFVSTLHASEKPNTSPIQCNMLYDQNVACTCVGKTRTLKAKLE